MWTDLVKALASFWSETWDTDISLLATFPAILVFGRRVIKDLAKNVRAKKALENQVLLAVQSDITARAAILSGKTHGNVSVSASAAFPPPMRPALDVTDVVTAAAATLEGEDAAVVQRALEQGEHHGRADYIDDIARHVTAKMAHSG